MTKRVSPAKKIRSFKRLFSFILQKRKPKLLAIKHLPEINFPPSVQSMVSKSSQTMQYQCTSSLVNISMLRQEPVSKSNSIPQLDGGGSDLRVQPPPQNVPYPSQCSTCKKNIEDQHDFNWHFGTEIGREDCRLLKSMLPF